MRAIPRLLLVVTVIVLALLLVLPVSAADKPAPQLQYTVMGTHTVKQGEWLYCIGRAYQVSPWAIAQQNYIPWPYWVYPGQVLQIPSVAWYNIPAGQTCAAQFTPPTGWPPPATPTPVSPTPGPYPTPVPGACRYYHTVRWGQTLSGIAWYYGTTVQAIMAANPSITNPNLIYAGQVLCIPSSPYYPPYPAPYSAPAPAPY